MQGGVLQALAILCEHSPAAQAKFVERASMTQLARELGSPDLEVACHAIASLHCAGCVTSALLKTRASLDLQVKACVRQALVQCHVCWTVLGGGAAMSQGEPGGTERFRLCDAGVFCSPGLREERDMQHEGLMGHRHGRGDPSCGEPAQPPPSGAALHSPQDPLQPHAGR